MARLIDFEFYFLFKARLGLNFEETGDVRSIMKHVPLKGLSREKGLHQTVSRVTIDILLPISHTAPLVARAVSWNVGELEAPAQGLRPVLPWPRGQWGFSDLLPSSGGSGICGSGASCPPRGSAHSARCALVPQRRTQRRRRRPRHDGTDTPRNEADREHSP